MSILSPMALEQFDLAEALRVGKKCMLTPQDLPGRYGRVVEAVDRWLAVLDCSAVIVGGWAVWRHGYAGRLTQNLDIVLPSDRLEEVLRVASVSSFVAPPTMGGRWPKLSHKDTGIDVDILPEGGRPGTAARPAPTTIPHPDRMGGVQGRLSYVSFPSLIELKLAAGRIRDESDVLELMRVNPETIAELRSHLRGVHPDYVAALDQLLARGADEELR